MISTNCESIKNSKNQNNLLNWYLGLEMYYNFQWKIMILIIQTYYTGILEFTQPVWLYGT